MSTQTEAVPTSVSVSNAPSTTSVPSSDALSTSLRSTATSLQEPSVTYPVISIDTLYVFTQGFFLLAEFASGSSKCQT